MQPHYKLPRTATVKKYTLSNTTAHFDVTHSGFPTNLVRFTTQFPFAILPSAVRTFRTSRDYILSSRVFFFFVISIDPATLLRRRAIIFLCPIVNRRSADTLISRRPCPTEIRAYTVIPMRAHGRAMGSTCAGRSRWQSEPVCAIHRWVFHSVAFQFSPGPAEFGRRRELDGVWVTEVFVRMMDLVFFVYWT